MNDLFDIKGADLDRGFENFKTTKSPIEQQLDTSIYRIWRGVEADTASAGRSETTFPRSHSRRRML